MTRLTLLYNLSVNLCTQKHLIFKKKIVTRKLFISLWYYVFQYKSLNYKGFYYCNHKINVRHNYII